MIQTINENDITKYVKEVSKHIHCDKKDKLNCLSTLRSTVEEISTQNDITDYNSIITVLGSPKSVAEELESSMDANVIKKHKRKIIISTIVFVMLIVGLLIGLYFYLVYDAVQPVYISESAADAVQSY